MKYKTLASVARASAAAGALALLWAAQSWAAASALPHDGGPETNQRTLAFALITGGLVWTLATVVRQRYALVKRLFDLVVASVGLVLVAPLLAGLVATIRLTSPGPAIFTQDRMGKRGKTFKMYKLRTMYVDAEKQTGAVWAKADDPRITPLGRWLRKTRLDEVPQLINVLKGDMSVIGPRPERPEFVARLSREIMDYDKRLVVAPGITGLAQVWSKYDETIEDVRRKVKYDLLYIRQMCLTADLGILLRTVLVVATGYGAR